MAQVNQIIEQAIAKAVRQKISNSLETFVKNEVLQELRRRGVSASNTPRERNNRTISLVEGRNLRKKIGSLVMDRVKDGMTEQLRFKLNGVQARDRRDSIDPRELSALVSRAIREKFGKRF